MKQIKVSILALSVLVGGAVFASAASIAILGSTTEVVLTNAPAPLIWYSVEDELPTSALLNPERGVRFEATVVDTDDGGKVSGAGNIIKRYYGNTADTNAVTAISSWYTTVKGSIKASQMGVATIQMTLKGEGYLAPGTNTTVVVPGDNVDAFPGKFNLNFKADKKVALPISTNESGRVTYAVVGNLKGTITPAVKGAKQEKIDQTATLVVDRTAMATISMRVIVSGSKFAAIATNEEIEGGTGTAKIDKNGKYTLNLKPVSGGSSKLTLKGQIAAVTQPPFTNITTISTADVTGKLQGQAVTGKAVFSKFVPDEPEGNVVANFTWTASQRTITFVNTSTGADSYLWDLGDGTTSTDQTPAPHQYAGTDQTVTVTLTATGPSGNNVKIQIVTFPPPPQ